MKNDLEGEACIRHSGMRRRRWPVSVWSGPAAARDLGDILVERG